MHGGLNNCPLETKENTAIHNIFVIVFERKKKTRQRKASSALPAHHARLNVQIKKSLANNTICKFTSEVLQLTLQGSLESRWHFSFHRSDCSEEL
jgi:hypothetical protein